ncbi:hypothetical protein L798_02256 [Zootermopsis nevadensis]|uniref:MADF domain-containing protein n=1 Tax=Zootermopsis nevadensis TaxID=136037 RepID=A0A067QUZ5_ZOONE|nr:hypothetical protein L798_02256 [Zootermopsis nevadensis]
MEWDDEKCLNLIDIYKNTPILWGPNDTNYYKMMFGLKLVLLCKQEMVTLLASYRREKMKIKKSMGTGKGRDALYESKWFAYTALEFLNDFHKPRKLPL